MAKSKVDKEELFKQVHKLIAKWQPRLGLSKWVIILEVANLSPEVAAQISWSPNYRKAVITVNPQVDTAEIELDAGVLEHNIIHELCHLLVAPIRDWAYREFEAEGSMWPAFSHANETTVDELAILFEVTWERMEYDSTSGLPALSSEQVSQ